ncbi:MAG TPA: endonuclease III [Bacteroidota bacterium]
MKQKTGQKAKKGNVKKVDWMKSFLPLFKKYEGRKHPLNYHNRYELIVLVILSSQMTDDRINALAPEFFRRYPTLKTLAGINPEEMYDIIRSVRGSKKKAKWLVEIATAVGDDANIPTTMEGLTNLPGIGRKSANVIIRESGGNAEGIIVDLHVLRVVPRLGLANEENPEKIEQKLMEVIPREYWNTAGMSFSFLGREICRPTDPRCTECMLHNVCEYYEEIRR